MLLPLLALLQLQLPADPPVHHGIRRELDVRIPRIEADVSMDGVLDEPAWRSAAVLTGFSMYQPVDQRPAPDSTEVLVWYSATAIHFGVRAFEPHGTVRATLADRDRVSTDDNVEIHLDTFLERKRAFVFIVNPLGVQADGTKSEGAGMFMPGQSVFPGQNDLSSDFRWQSRGRLTDQGYEVEVRIPFTSLRYPIGGPRDWGVQVVRKVQHSGYELTWTPARKGAASFIAQAGTLRGLHDLRRGQVVELNPEVTTSVDGAAPVAAGGGAGDWRYETTPTLGGNVTWSMAPNLVLNGTVRPDFSQVEADALQIAGDARFDLFYAERRPFFVDGIERFNVPSSLVYTRRIVRPTGAAKLTARAGRTDVALLSAVDDPVTSASGTDDPLWSVLRVRRDVGAQSTVGLVVTSREETADRWNRVAGADARYVFGRLYYAEFQVVGSMTARGGARTPFAPLWTAAVDRTGRSFGFHYQITGIDPDFATAAGFVPRTGYVQPQINNRYTRFGRPGSAFERYNVFLQVSGTWRYDDFFAGKSLLENRASASNDFTFRGGWTVSLTPAVASYAFDPAAYARYRVPRPAGDTAAFRASDRVATLVLGARVSTPQFRRGSASAGTSVGNDVDFFETSRVRRRDANATVDWRPTEKVRATASYVSSAFTRRADGASIATTRIPRLRVEYQVARPVFVRFVGQYESVHRAPLVDPRSGAPILLPSATGAYAASAEQRRNDLRVDWLFSYRPAPGTVLFAGYGSSLREPDALAFRDLARVRDGFFFKGSYLLRL